MTVEVDFDPEVTDDEGLSNGLDTLLETAMSTPDILDDYGNPDVGPFIPRQRVWADVFVRSVLCQGCAHHQAEPALQPPGACRECWTLRPSRYKAR
jgi:hypothetical protein